MTRMGIHRANVAYQAGFIHRDRSTDPPAMMMKENTIDSMLVIDQRSVGIDDGQKPNQIDLQFSNEQSKIINNE